MSRPEPGNGPARTEFDLIESIRRRSRLRTSFVPVGIGDDCAVLQPHADARLVVTTDQMVEGVHFERRWMHASFLGRKALRVSLSDIAAMGAVPQACLLSVALPRRHRGRFFDQLLESLLDDCRGFSTPLVGGDLAVGDRLVVTTTLIGSHPGQPLLRSEAGPGDIIGVAGQLGWSALGLSLLTEWSSEPPLANEAEVAQWAPSRDEERAILAQLLPPVSIATGRRLAEAGVRAAIDVSDGFGRDLGHVLSASRVGAEVSTGALRDLSPGGSAGEQLALEGGEDYALVFSLPAEVELDEDVSWTSVGEFSANPGELALRSGASRRLYSAKGYDHFA